MKANNLTVSVAGGCHKKCPYCVSNMTPRVEHNPGLYVANMHRAKNLAWLSNVSSVLITGKGEPLLNAPDTHMVAKYFSDTWPVEIQVSDRALIDSHFNPSEYGYTQEWEAIDGLAENGVGLVAISMESPTVIDRMGVLRHIIQYLHEKNMIIRLTVNLIFAADIDTSGWIEQLQGAIKPFPAIRQVTFRRISIPERVEGDVLAQTTADWIRHKIDHNSVASFLDHLGAWLDQRGRPIRQTTFGAVINDVDGVAYTWFPYCIQDRAGEEEIRSLIYMEDGHLYTSWGSRASILF